MGDKEKKQVTRHLPDVETHSRHSSTIMQKSTQCCILQATVSKLDKSCVSTRRCTYVSEYLKFHIALHRHTHEYPKQKR